MADGGYSASEVAAMVSLLNDDSDKVVERCHDALLSVPDEAEAALRDVLERADQVDRPVYESVLADVVASRWEQPVIDEIAGEADLERGALLIGRLVDPDCDAAWVGVLLDRMAAKVGNRLAGVDDYADDGVEPLGPVDALRAVLVDEFQLRGAPPSRVNVESATLHGALRDERGLPLPLCIAWILVGRRAGLPIEGLNMPNHFLIRHRVDDEQGAAIDTVLDPFHGGRAVKGEDCRRMLRMAGYTSTNIEPLAASDRDMLERTLRNLFMLASRADQPRLAARCRRILKAGTRSREG